MVESLHYRFLPAIEDALKAHWNQSLINAPAELRKMIAYHMGWENSKNKKIVIGKRIRPTLILLVVDTIGKDWIPALPAAIAVEYLHNFSLIHDDIQDQSKTRHSRDTLWLRWGIPQAINTGDAMFSMAYQALIKSREYYSDPIVNQLVATFSQACLRLTEGQHLDISFEKIERISETDYLTMIIGKTASLFGCCARMGAILSSLSMKEQDLLEQFGLHLGLAFQIQDDILGIWGVQENTGKSTSTDLVSGKKTLPIVHALNQSDEFYSAWSRDHITSEGIRRLMGLFKQTNSYDYAKKCIEDHNRSALKALHKISQDFPAGFQNLESLINHLLAREI